jgi:hypothetical protein
LAAAALLLPGGALAQEPPGESSGLHITSPRPVNGHGEWQPADSDQGFLSIAPIVCEATIGPEPASADPDAPAEDHPPKAAPVHWWIKVYRGGRGIGTITGSGSPFTFRPADASPRHFSGPLAVEIIAEATSSDESGASGEAQRPPNPKSKIQNPKLHDRVWLRQDEIDQLRQEYLDLPGRKLDLVPRREFVDRAAYERSGDVSPQEPAPDRDAESGEDRVSEASLRIPWAELNRTQRRGGGVYRYILFTDALRDGLRRWQELLGSRVLSINSGFRNPFKQSITNGRRGHEGAPGSMHQYGRAVDARASLRQDFRDWIRVAWAALDAGADYVETAPEGGWSHVHADWRRDGQGPPLTVKLEIAGRVVDPEGQPVPAAHVLGTSDAAGGTAGMPAWEGPDADGQFTLRTVWRPGRPYRLRARTEQSAGTQLLTVPEGATGLVHLETELVLTPDAFRTALLHRPFHLASRGYWRHRRRQRG